MKSRIKLIFVFFLILTGCSLVKEKQDVRSSIYPAKLVPIEKMARQGKSKDAL